MIPWLIASRFSVEKIRTPALNECFYSLGSRLDLLLQLELLIAPEKLGGLKRNKSYLLVAVVKKKKELTKSSLWRCGLDEFVINTTTRI